MGMGENHCVNFKNSFLVKIRSDNHFPGVEGTFSEAPAVDEHISPAGKADQGGGSLTDINGGYSQISGIFIPEGQIDCITDKEKQHEDECAAQYQGMPREKTFSFPFYIDKLQKKDQKQIINNNFENIRFRNAERRPGVGSQAINYLHRYENKKGCCLHKETGDDG